MAGLRRKDVPNLGLFWEVREALGFVVNHPLCANLDVTRMARSLLMTTSASPVGLFLTEDEAAEMRPILDEYDRLRREGVVR